jgi:hypothetical protein
MKRFLVLLLLAGVSGRAQSQQIADPNFDASVEHPRFVRSHPRVLFDESHHNVHKSTTTYKAFVDLLRNDGLSVDRNDRPFTPERLARYRMLVIAGALGAPLSDSARAQDPAFTPAEIEAVRKWVDRGGGLLLLTDHEPVASAGASLVRAFGVEPTGKVVIDAEHAFEDHYPTNIAATRENGLLAEHPLTARVRRAVVFGGQSLRFPPRAVVLIRVGSSAQNREGGLVAGNGQAGAMQFGRGRVVITGDMGMLSAQLVTENGVTSPWGMNVPGVDNRHLVRNIAHWLAGSR